MPGISDIVADAFPMPAGSFAVEVLESPHGRML